MQIILASQSPRRRVLLEEMGVPFIVQPSDFDEVLDDSRLPEVVAAELALGKAISVAAEHPDAYVIGGDTIVTIDGKQLGKPTDIAEVRRMLHRLAGTAHTVTSGVALVHVASGLQLTGSDTAYVYFRPYDEVAVERYLATGDSLDKAGGYGIQSGGAPLVERIEGGYDTVIGLPKQLLARYLKQAGIPAGILSAENTD